MYEIRAPFHVNEFSMKLVFIRTFKGYADRILMTMKLNFTTSRLLLSPLNESHDLFIVDLVNSPDWLKFIGDRKVRTSEHAKAYINRINSNSGITYWVVSRQTDQQPIGIITYIKRDYLEFPDIGFAFLPDYMKSGYAFEAASEVMRYLAEQRFSDRLLAVTVPDNDRSIRLLHKLGFVFDKAIENAKESLSVYRSDLAETH